MRSLGVLAMILAGGRGERLYPLTARRCKPAVPFGGSFRVIDFTLINCALSGLSECHVVTQCLAEPLNRHVKAVWSSQERGIAVRVLPPPHPAKPYIGRGRRGVRGILRREPDEGGRDHLADLAPLW